MMVMGMGMTGACHHRGRWGRWRQRKLRGALCGGRDSDRVGGINRACCGAAVEATGRLPRGTFRRGRGGRGDRKRPALHATNPPLATAQRNGTGALLSLQPLGLGRVGVSI